MDEHRLSITVSELNDEDKIVNDLLNRSYAVVRVTREDALLDSIFLHREQIFEDAFALAHDFKESQGLFRTSPKSGSVGYRSEGTREFFETRITAMGNIEPCIPIEGYEPAVISIFKHLNSVGVRVLASISKYLRVDPTFILDLIDNDLTTIDPGQYGASVLRICKYPCTKGEIGFGSHTDTSFLTLAPLSSCPGLDVYDYVDNAWVTIEEKYKGDPYLVVVLVGEFLQILFKQRFFACVHRVRFPSSGIRYSCPLLIRGKHVTVLESRNIKYKHLCDEESLSNTIANLDGVSMMEVHTLLDLKRKRCAKLNSDNENQAWVLAAFHPKNRVPIP
jgi:hypothetical protein